MTLSTDRADILQTASGLRPVQLEARFDWWRKASFSSGVAGEMVKRSRGFPMPGFDEVDRKILAAERGYYEAMEQARSALGRARAIEQTWLVEIHVATKEEAAQASDSGVDCKRCLRPVACTPADKLLAGFCRSCYQWWCRNGRPDIVKIVPEEEQPKRVKVAPNGAA